MSDCAIFSFMRKVDLPYLREFADDYYATGRNKKCASMENDGELGKEGEGLEKNEEKVSVEKIWENKRYFGPSIPGED